MDLSLKTDLEYYAPEIISCFKEGLTVHRCGMRLKAKGFPLDEGQDLRHGSRLIETIKDILIERLQMDDDVKRVSGSYFFEALKNRDKDDASKSKWIFLTLIEILPKKSGLGSLKQHKQGFLTTLQTNWPWMLTWFPKYNLEIFKNEFSLSIEQ